MHPEPLELRLLPLNSNLCQHNHGVPELHYLGRDLIDRFIEDHKKGVARAKEFSLRPVVLDTPVPFEDIHCIAQTIQLRLGKGNFVHEYLGRLADS